jgi:hypothetical protein
MLKPELYDEGMHSAHRGPDTQQPTSTPIASDVTRLIAGILVAIALESAHA